MMTTAHFDRLAGVYRALEYVAFGRLLERARTVLLPALSSCGDILLVGDGDGRCLEALVALAPRARVTSLDASKAMIARARRRIAGTDNESRVSFERVDARSWRCRPARFDAIVTMFVLDCFTAADVAAIVRSMAPSLRNDGLWLFVDFAVPRSGLGRLHALLWVKTLYAFFRLQTGIDARTLPPSEAILERHGFRRSEVREFRAGLVRSVLFERIHA
jgi:ubiquinone/menaquinone biosynthesis C-methylase UbiE